MRTVPLIIFKATGLPLGSLILTFDRFILDVPADPMADILIIKNVPGVDILDLPIIASKIFTTVPEGLLMILPLKKVLSPFCLKRFPSVMRFILRIDLLNTISSCAPAMGALPGSIVTIRSNDRPVGTILLAGTMSAAVEMGISNRIANSRIPSFKIDFFLRSFLQICIPFSTSSTKIFIVKYHI